MKIKIKKTISTSLIDWEGKIVTTLYVPRCNFRCPFCYNCELILNPESLDDISIEEINDDLMNRKEFIDGICMSGGEPTLYPELSQYFDRLKNKGFLIKLDTNGTNPLLLKKLLDHELVDYIAMDIKSSLDFEHYSKAAGIKDKHFLSKILESIDLIMNSKIDYEFRTTIVPLLHDKDIIEKIAKHISGAKKYVLQNFSSQEKMLDASFEKIKPYSDEKIREFSEQLKEYVPNCYCK